jgi:predicted HAD superfamily phosphohydrolase
MENNFIGDDDSDGSIDETEFENIIGLIQEPFVAVMSDDSNPQNDIISITSNENVDNSVEMVENINPDSLKLINEFSVEKFYEVH